MVRIDVGEITLNYESAGEGPAVVLTHGLGGSVGAWETLAERLRMQHRVVTWDVRGFGDSDRPDGPVGPAVWARDLNQLLRAIDLEHAVIAGISMGGVIAQRFALDFPERTDGLILLSTSSEVGLAATAAWRARADLVERDGLAAALQVGPALSYSRRYREEHAEAIAAATRRTIARNSPHVYAAACRAVADYSFTAELATLACRTLILQGTEDELTPPGGSVILQRTIPGAVLCWVQGSGHDVVTEDAQGTLRCLEDFLRGDRTHEPSAM